MEEETLLSDVLSDPKKTSFISANQLILNYCDITNLDNVLPHFQKIKKLFLSHNKISNLSGIEQFKYLTHLSIGYNQIDSLKELNKIFNKESLKCLMIQGNPLEKHPNHKVLILDIFPNLEKLNELTVNKKFRASLEKRTSIIQKNFITFLYFLFEEINNLENLLNKLKISKELKNLLARNTKISDPQEKVNEIVGSEKSMSKFKNLVNFQRIEGIKSLFNKKKFNEKFEVMSTLKNLCEILTNIYGPYDNIVINNRQAFYTIYKCSYIELIEKLRNKFDKNLEHFLLNKIIENELINKEKFAEDNEYALDCMLSAFYQLLPTQAFINNVICYDKKNDLLSPSKEYFQPNNQFFQEGFSNLSPDNLSNRIYKWVHGKEIWKYKKNEIINELEINEKNPENIKNVLLIHFPIFPLNKTYMESVLEIINNKIQLLLSFHSQMLQILDIPQIVKAPHFKVENPKNIGENLLMEKNLETLRIKSNDENKENYKGDNISFEEKEMSQNINMKSTLKIKNLQQCNEVFSINKTQKNFENQAKKNTLKKSILKKNCAETVASKLNNYPIEEKIQSLKKKNLTIFYKFIKERLRSQMKYGFSLICRHSNFLKKKLKEKIYQRKKLLNRLSDIFNTFSTKKKYFVKKKGFQNVVKKMKSNEKLRILNELKLRRFFNLLYQNVVDKQLLILSHYERLLKSKAFFYMLKASCNKKKLKNLMKKMVKTIFKKKIQNCFSKWKEFEIKKFNHLKDFSKKSSLNYSKMRDLLKEDKKLSSIKNHDLENSYENLNLFSKDEKIINSKNNAFKCKCTHYFRKCGACETLNFN